MVVTIPNSFIDITSVCDKGGRISSCRQVQGVGSLKESVTKGGVVGEVAGRIGRVGATTTPSGSAR
jgi:hypothetical protein